MQRQVDSTVTGVATEVRGQPRINIQTPYYTLVAEKKILGDRQQRRWQACLAGLSLLRHNLQTELVTTTFDAQGPLSVKDTVSRTNDIQANIYNVADLVTAVTYGWKPSGDPTPGKDRYYFNDRENEELYTDLIQRSIDVPNSPSPTVIHVGSKIAAEAVEDMFYSFVHDAFNPVAAAKLNNQLAQRSLGREPLDLTRTQVLLEREIKCLGSAYRVIEEMSEGLETIFTAFPVATSEILKAVEEEAANQVGYSNPVERSGQFRINVDSQNVGGEALQQVISWNPYWVKQLFKNIVGNAIKAHEVGRDTIHLSTKMLPASRRQKAPMLELTIDDDGHGFNPEYLTEGNGRFVRFGRHGGWKNPGQETTGVGMYAQQRILETIFGGTMHIENRLSEGGEILGSRIVIGIPIAPSGSQ